MSLDCGRKLEHAKEAQTKQKRRENEDLNPGQSWCETKMDVHEKQTHKLINQYNSWEQLKTGCLHLQYQWGLLQLRYSDKEEKIRKQQGSNLLK